MAASNLYYSAGQPSDSTGAAGDFNWDTTNRIFWGPKTSGGTWVGTGNSVAGPAGAAMLAGVGAPASSYGSNGQGYTDTSTGLTYYKSSNAWAQSGSIVGPQGSVGPAGFTSMPASAWSPGPIVVANAVTLSSTPQTVVAQGTSVPQYYTPGSASALLGVGITCNTSAATVALYDTTSSTTVYTVSCAVNTNNWLGAFAQTTYPLTANHAYVWQVSGSGTSTVQISPIYLTPSSAAVPAIGPVANWATPTSTTFSSTATATYAGGVKLASAKSFYFIRAGSMFSATATYTPSVAGAAAASVQLQFGSYNNSATSTVYTSGSVTNNSTPTAFGPFTPGQYAWAASTLMYINVIGSGTGQVNVDVNVIV